MKKQQWQTHVKAFNKSGLSKREYADSHKLVYHQFVYWSQKISQPSADAFVPVKLTPEPPVQKITAPPGCPVPLDQNTQAVAEGANLLCGNDRDKSLFAPTVLENVPMNSKVLCDEVFAPIVSFVAVENIAEAIEIANEPEYSLHAGIFTKDLECALSAADAIEASGIMINDSSDYRFDAMPFGGYKLGGLGREGVKFAMEEMSQTKVICFNRG